MSLIDLFFFSLLLFFSPLFTPSWFFSCFFFFYWQLRKVLQWSGDALFFFFDVGVLLNTIYQNRVTAQRAMREMLVFPLAYSFLYSVLPSFLCFFFFLRAQLMPRVICCFVIPLSQKKKKLPFFCLSVFFFFFLHFICISLNTLLLGLPENSTNNNKRKIT